MAEKIWNVGLDAGHGLKTAGKQTPTGIKEWTLNDKVRDKVVEFLKGYNVKFVFPDNNEGNTDESLASRLNMYLNAGVDAFVSIHHNAFTGSWNTATGVEVYTDRNPIAKDTQLANCIYKRLVSYTGMQGRGVKKENWYVINQNRIPAVLVEGGFMDGSKDYEYITSDKGQTEYARAVADGLIEFLGLKKTSSTTPTPSATPNSASVPFLIKVDNVEKGDVLNIRKEPNADADKTGSLEYNDPNTYTIVEVKDGWGKLLSGIGWIHLHYTEVVGELPQEKNEAGVPFLIRVDKVKKGDVLNIRKEPNADADKTGSLAYNDKNTYTIVEVKDGWGRLKSGIGWICLDYTKKEE